MGPTAPASNVSSRHLNTVKFRHALPFGRLLRSTRPSRSRTPVSSWDGLVIVTQRISQPGGAGAKDSVAGGRDLSLPSCMRTVTAPLLLIDCTYRRWVSHKIKDLEEWSLTRTSFSTVNARALKWRLYARTSPSLTASYLIRSARVRPDDPLRRKAARYIEL